MTDSKPLEPNTKLPNLIEVDHYEAIRLISGIFQDNPVEMATRLSLCNLLARNALGLASDDFTNEQMVNIGVKLKRPAPLTTEEGACL